MGAVVHGKSSVWCFDEIGDAVLDAKNYRVAIFGGNPDEWLFEVGTWRFPKGSSLGRVVADVDLGLECTGFRRQPLRAKKTVRIVMSHTCSRYLHSHNAWLRKR